MSDSYKEKIQQLIEATKNFVDTSCLIVVSEESHLDDYAQSSAFFIWLFGYDIPNSILVFSLTKKTIYLFSEQSKYKYLEQLKNSSGVKIMVKKLSEFEDKVRKEEFGGNRNAFLCVEKNKGDLSSKVQSICLTNFDIKESNDLLSEMFAIKLPIEMENIQKASELCSAVYKHLVVPEIETIVDEDIKTPHKSLSKSIEEAISTPSKVKINLDPNFLESCYSPCIQSGGKYNLRLSAQSDKRPLDCSNGAPVLISLGVRYKSYCCNMARTLLFNPSEEQKRDYEVLNCAFNAARDKLKNGVEIKEVFGEALNVIEREIPMKKQYFAKNCGFGTGIRFRDENLVINDKNENKIKNGMVFNLNLRLGVIKDTVKEIDYAIQIADTFAINETGTESLTKAPQKLKNISYSIEKLISAEKENSKEITKETNSPRRKTRSKRPLMSVEDEIKIKTKRVKLLSERIHKALSVEIKEDKKIEENVSEVAESYTDPKSMPSVKSFFKIHCDETTGTILLPISGGLMPLNVSCVKSLQMTHSDKINLLQISLKLKTDSLVSIGEVIFRSKNHSNFQKVIETVRRLKKSQTKDTKLPKTTLQENKQLLLINDKGQLPRLSHVKVRPRITGKKNTTGILESHRNGFLFSLNASRMKSIKTNILYENVSHAFFKPAHNSASVLFHLHLIKPIKLGKPTRELQFYVDVVETSQNIDRPGHSELDAIRQEQREEAFKKKLNRVFKEFSRSTDKIVRSNCPDSKLKIEKVSEEVKFNGVPNRSSVTIYATKDCLVSFEEFPPFVLPLGEVEVAHFERVQFQLKHFDLVFVMKGLKEYKRIDAIPSENLSFLRKYLDELDVISFASSVNLDWDKVLKEINSNIKEFWQNGGWNFLDKGEKENSSSENLSESSGEDFEPSSEEEESYSDKSGENSDESYENSD